MFVGAKFAKKSLIHKLSTHNLPLPAPKSLFFCVGHPTFIAKFAIRLWYRRALLFHDKESEVECCTSILNAQYALTVRAFMSNRHLMEVTSTDIRPPL